MGQRTGGVAATDAEIDGILANARRIAVVGLSRDPGKTSHRIAQYLKSAGYQIIPVNPTAPGHILGEKVYRRLADVPGRVDVVDVFRPAGFALEIVRETAAARAPVIWFQLGCTGAEAVNEAVSRGLRVVHDRCVMVEHRRYSHR